MSQPSVASIKVYHEGMLLKYPRTTHFIVKFHERFCRLTLISLKYYDKAVVSPDDPPKGTFEVSHIRIVEEVQREVFGRDFCFQVGNENEVIYFAASSNEKREEWIKQFRQVAADNGNKMLEEYHSGTYTRKLPSIHSCWSCCRNTDRTSVGCQKTFAFVPPPKLPPPRKISAGPLSSTKHPSSSSPAASVAQDNIYHQFKLTDQDTGQLILHKQTSLAEGTGETSEDSALPKLSQWSSEDSVLSPALGREQTPLANKNKSKPLKLPVAVSSTQPSSSSLSEIRPQITSAFSALEAEDYEQLHRIVKDVEDINIVHPTKKLSLLQLACKRGLRKFAELLLQHDAEVNQADELFERTPLHEAAMIGNYGIVELLLEQEADPLARDSNDDTPYDLALRRKNYDVMDILCESIPPSVRPYVPFEYYSSLPSNTVTALAFSGASTLASGSTTSSVQIWDIPDLTFESSIRTTGATSSLSVWGDFLAIGSNFVQIIDSSDKKVRRIFIADDEQQQTPPMQLVAFGLQGHLATVNSESKTVKVWPPPSQTEEFITEPIWTSGSTLGSVTPGSLCSLSMSSNEEQPWLAIGIAAGKGTKGFVHLLNWKDKGSHHILSAGVINGVGAVWTAFSNSGQYIATGCANRLAIWELKSRAEVYELPNHTDGAISSLCYSPDDAHLAVGMCTGEVVVYEVESGGPIFTLERPENDNSPASTMAYSSSSSYFVAGYKNGKIQLWKTYQDLPESLPTTTTEDRHLSESKELSKLSCCSDLPLIGRVEDEIQSREEEYIMEFLDYKIVIPANATREGRKIPFQTGEMPLGPVGPFKFPPNTKPVSSIVWFHSNGMSDLQKPIKIVLSHCLNCTSDEDLKRLVFMRAGDDNTITADQNGEKEFEFHAVEEEESSFTFKDGTLASQHSCLYCIGTHTRNDAEMATYCLTEAISTALTSDTSEIHFILSYFLESCFKTIEESYGDKFQFKRHRVTFTHQEKLNHGPSMQITFQHNLLQNWTITCNGLRQIPIKDVCFWNFSTVEEFVLAYKERLYPPRISLEVSGSEALEDGVLNVVVSGCDEELKRDILLKKTGNSLSQI